MPHRSFNKKTNLVPALTAVVGMCLSGTLLAIWLFFPSLKELSSRTMKANTALGLLLASIALWLLKERSQTATRLRIYVGYFLASIVILIGASTATEYLLGVNLGIDEILATDFRNAESSLFPGRMSPNASVCFLLLGAGLLFINVSRPGKIHFASLFLIPLVIGSSLSLIGYVYSERSFYQIGPYIRISWQSALLFLNLAIGTLFSRPYQGPIRVFTSEGLGGVIARRLVPLVVALPFFLGLLWLYARRYELVSRELGVALFVVTIILTLVIVVSFAAKRLDLLESKEREIFKREKEIRSRFMDVLEHAPLVVWALDRSGRYTLSEGRALENLGLRPGELIGKNHFELFKGNVEAIEYAKRALQGNAFTAEATVNGRVFNTNYAPFFDDRGQVIGISAVSTDITDRKRDLERLQYQSDLTRIITENVPSCLFMMDERGFATYMNPVAEKVTGYKLEELKEKPLHYYVHHHRTDGRSYPMEECPLWATYTHHTSVRQQEEVFIRKDGSYFPVNFSIVPILSDGILKGAVLEFRDITEQKKIETEFLQAKEEAERANRAKSQFLANMSHEIRSPMNSVLGYAELLADKNLSVQDRLDYVRRIQSSGQHLMSVIDDILDLSKVEAGQIRIEKKRFSVMALIEECVDAMNPLAKQRGIDLCMDCETAVPAWIESDRARLKQIVMNLLSNAIKFTERGYVIVRLKQVQREELNRAAELFIEVEDSGIGIASESQERLFLPFSQIDDSITRKYGGTGLGLSLSRHLAHVLGGKLILAWSQPGKGSCFTLSLEYAQTHGVDSVYTEESHQVESDSSSTVLNLESTRILLVEDSPENQTLMKIYLGKAGVQVDIANNGKEALDKTGRQRYDLVLMDVQMPVLDGLEATRRLREQGFDTPIIALTAHAMKEDVEKSIRAGCNAHLSKPVDRKELIRVVNSFVSNERV